MLVKHPDRVGRRRRQERLNRIVQFQMPIAAFGIARARTDIRSHTDILKTRSRCSAVTGFTVSLRHTHRRGQLVWVAAGVVVTTTDRGTWLALPNRVSWTPSGFVRAHRFYGRTDGRVIPVPADLASALPPRPSVFAVTSLLREVILALTERSAVGADASQHLLAVAVDEVTTLVEAGDEMPHFPEPHDDRLLAVAEALRADRATTATLAAAALGDVTRVIIAGVSPVQASPERVLAVDLIGTAVAIEEFGAIIASGGSGIVVASMAGHMGDG